MRKINWLITVLVIVVVGTFIAVDLWAAPRGGGRGPMVSRPMGVTGGGNNFVRPSPPPQINYSPPVINQTPRNWQQPRPNNFYSGPKPKPNFQPGSGSGVVGGNKPQLNQPRNPGFVNSGNRPQLGGVKGPSISGSSLNVRPNGSSGPKVSGSVGGSTGRPPGGVYPDGYGFNATAALQNFIGGGKGKSGSGGVNTGLNQPTNQQKNKGIGKNNQGSNEGIDQTGNKNHAVQHTVQHINSHDKYTIGGKGKGGKGKDNCPNPNPNPNPNPGPGQQGQQQSQQQTQNNNQSQYNNQRQNNQQTNQQTNRQTTNLSNIGNPRVTTNTTATGGESKSISNATGGSSKVDVSGGNSCNTNTNVAKTGDQTTNLKFSLFGNDGSGGSGMSSILAAALANALNVNTGVGGNNLMNPFAFPQIMPQNQFPFQFPANQGFSAFPPMQYQQPTEVVVNNQIEPACPYPPSYTELWGVGYAEVDAPYRRTYAQAPQEETPVKARKLEGCGCDLLLCDSTGRIYYPWSDRSCKITVRCRTVENFNPADHFQVYLEITDQYRIPYCKERLIAYLLKDSRWIYIPVCGRIFEINKKQWEAGWALYRKEVKEVPEAANRKERVLQLKLF